MTSGTAPRPPCKAASAAAGIEYTLNRGEGAFYGPKLEFVLRDAIGRDWQCGTLQVDLNMPERLGAYYIDEHSAKRTPVMLHRAMFGSLERFFGDSAGAPRRASCPPGWPRCRRWCMSITDRQNELRHAGCGIPEKSGSSGRVRLAKREGRL